MKDLEGIRLDNEAAIKREKAHKDLQLRIAEWRRTHEKPREEERA